MTKGPKAANDAVAKASKKPTAKKLARTPPRRANPLRPGDVLLTNPQPGWWGCAVVLSARDQTADAWPESHVGIATRVAHAPIRPGAFDPAALELLVFRAKIRVGPGDFREDPTSRTAIEIRSIPKGYTPTVIGHVDPVALWPHRLTFAIGDGTGRRFPHGGPIDDAFGSDAVDAWRELHDAEAFARENAEAQALFEAFEAG